MTLRLLCPFLAIVLAAVSHSASAQNNPTQLILSIKLCETSSEGAKSKTLAEPSIVATSGRAFSFRSGGSAKPNIGDGDFDIGTNITGKFELTAAGAAQLILKIRVATAIAQEENPKAGDAARSDIVRTEILEIRTLLKPGEARRFDCSDHQWCELRVDPVK